MSNITVRGILTGAMAMGLSVWLPPFGPVALYAIDNPHNSNNAMTCSTCHDDAKSAATPTWWTEQDANVCGQCHNPSAMPGLDASTHKRGTDVLAQCTMCHDPHTQTQNRNWTTQSYLYTGTSDPAGGVTQSTVKKTGADWTLDQWKGMVLIPNVRYQSFSYRIASNSADTITIDTGGVAPDNAINLAYAKPGNTFAIVYGRLVRENIGGSPVKFFRNAGANSFADAGTIDGVCQVCHDSTTSFRNNGVLEGPNHPPSAAGTKCTVCHNHSSGFKPSCQDCHGTPPLNGTLGGPDGLADNEGGTGSSTAGAHQKHAITLAYSCEACHSGGMPESAIYDKRVQIGFTIPNGAYSGGTYDGRNSPANGYSYASGKPGTVVTQNGTQVCSNMYCHSDGTSVATGSFPTGSSPSWAGGTTACNSCHGYPPSYENGTPKPNSHNAHAYSCENCHNATTTNGSAITNAANHLNNVYDLQPGPGKEFSYTFAQPNGTCSNISCHGSTGTQWGASSCLNCHAVPQGGRAAVAQQFSGNSHHVQGAAVNGTHCYRCHWEANADGSINQPYHAGSAAPGSAVNLVIYGAGTRPASYTVDVTAVEYTANGTRSQIMKITPHCLGCHSDQNNTSQPFGDGKTPKHYAWDGTSVALRSAQTGTVAWGKYNSTTHPNVTPKDRRTKAFSAHGNAVNNEGGWDLNETWPNTRGGSTNIACFDCHNSHGSSVDGRTTSYTSATVNGGILKETTANQGGYTMSYKPAAGGSSEEKNVRNAGASLCLDCHLTADGGSAQPWGYQATFGAAQEIIGYFDSPYMTPGGSASSRRYTYKSLVKNAGGHFGASTPLSNGPMGAINGLCTPCHDPHGVSPTLGSNQQYAVPLLKGTWVTSFYREDAAPSSPYEYTNVPGYEGVQYHIDQNTFGTTIRDVITGITQTAAQFAGLCLGCHPKSSLTDGTNGGVWKSVDRVHESVKGWGANVKHNYTCSKCHTPHNGASLPRLMVTNCLQGSQKGRNTTLSPVLFYSNSGSGNNGGGSGSGRIPGSYYGDGGGDECCGGPRPGDGIVTCHENRTGSGTDQSWNVKTPWTSHAPAMPVLIDEANTGCGSSCTVLLNWHPSADPEGHAVQYLVQVDDNPDFSSPAYVSPWLSGTSVTTTAFATSTIYSWRVKARDTVDLEESLWSSADTFRFSVPAPPPAPSVVDEPDSWCLTGCGVRLTWNPVNAPDEDPVTYSVQVDDNADFSSPLFTSSWSSYTFVDAPVLASGTLYYWRVRASDQLHPTEISGWSASDSFSVLEPLPPAVPTLIDKQNGTCGGTCGTAFQWNAAAPLPDGHAVGYQLVVDDTPDFSSPVYTSYWTTYTNMTVNLATSTIYYWRVKARDNGHTALESGWSASDQFEYIIGAPGQPVLIDEPDAVCAVACDQTLEWNAVTAPDGHGVEYAVEVDDAENFTSPNYSSGWTANTNWTMMMDTATTWYWRVKARDASHTWAVSPSSATDSFRINQAPAPPTPTMGTPGGYNYYSDCTNPVAVTLTWNAVIAPDSDPVQYYAEVTDGMTTWSSGWTAGLNWNFPAAAQSGYQWRMKARDAIHTSAESSWSTWDYFGDYSSCGPPSCPILYDWNGSTYAFETDVFSRGILGRPLGSTYMRANPHDYYLLANAPSAKENQYEFKYVEERAEIDYVDEVKLYTVDIPENRNVYAEANVTTSPTFYPPAQILHTVDTMERLAVSAVHVNTGQDVAAKLAVADGDYLVLNEHREYPSWQTIEMDLGDLSSAPRIKLIIKGVQAFPLTIAGNNRAKVVPGLKVKLEVSDGAGGWTDVTSRVRIANLGEFVRPMLVDISNIFTQGIYRIRLSYFTKNMIDSITFDATADEALTITELPFVSAELAYGGFNEKVSIFEEIATYIYGSKLEKTLPVMPGAYTKFGDVTPLLSTVDDEFVIMGQGDELTYRFSTPSPPAEGKSRKLLLYGNGYYKAHKYEHTRTVEPLPFAAMSNFPYNPAIENYPSDADHNQYRLEYNTRVQ